MTQLIQLWLWTMTLCGVLYFTTSSYLFSFVRIAILKRSGFFSTLVYCASCSGFWFGAVLVSLFPAPTGNIWIDVLLSGTCGMTTGTLWRLVYGDYKTFDSEFATAFPGPDDDVKEESHGDT
jgi:hypothetical protein